MPVIVIQTPAEQEHVFGAYADPKALQNRQNEIIQNGGVKAGFGKEEEVPKIPARHSAQEMEQHYAAPENAVQQPVQQMEGKIPSANISQVENTQISSISPSWLNNIGKLIGEKGNSHRIRQMPSIKGAIEDSKDFIEKTQQHLLANGYKLVAGTRPKTKNGEPFEKRTFRKRNNEVSINLRKDTASSNRNKEGTITVDIHNHPDILKKYKTNFIKFKFFQ